MLRVITILGFSLFIYTNPLYSQTDTLHVSQHQEEKAEEKKINGSRPFLEAEVQYKANDSISSDFEHQKMYLFGKAEIKYMDIELTAHVIELDLDSTLAIAYGYVDTTGVEQDLPVFKDKSGSYTMRRMKYNFETKKAIIEHIVTEQGEGFVVGQKAKRVNENEYFMRDAKYTTCDNHDHPHFYLNLSKAKVRPEKDVVTGPAWLVVADVPLFPIVLPFAFFPFTKTYSSGIIMPSYGDEMERGFYLHNGGYYFAINDYVDLAVTGEIYTKGTWGIGAQSNYRKRYKFSGNFNTYYLNTVLGDKGLPDYSVSKDFRISWTHSQDPKANMYRTLSASVNFSTSKYGKNDMTQLYSRESTNNTKSSIVNLTQRFPNSPWSLSAAMSINQISRDSIISVTLH